MAYYKVVHVYRVVAGSGREALEAVRRDERLAHLEAEFARELPENTGWLATFRKQLGL